MGLSSSYSSQTTFNMAANGKNKIMPAIPQTEAPIMMLRIEVKALIFKFPPTIFGVGKLLSIN